ncbi:MAG: AbrB/MazE/SpoVT family DNA-binding domain-containing protein [Nitrospirae bacterium]|jgi:AbrB family looped-hinge helix DNA binding protein|nr:AbrB/MazE/SpoVT family DNA-binding domain-containing protein [Nitrospirota bacterium]NTW66995.1 AbrB/MazE/SpoVT family DNA-binding domain-containing protein [Nitrospirota bacterium]
MSTVTKKGQVTIPKPVRDRFHIKEGDSLQFEVKDNVLILRRKERKSLLNLGGIAKGRKLGTGSEREYAKKAVARKIAREGV